MPAVQYDYDYYEYGNSRRSSAKAATSNRATRKTPASTNRTKTRTSNQTVSQARRGTSQKIEVTPSTTRNITRTSTRAVTRENVGNTQRKRSTSKNIEVPTMVSKRQIQKPKEMSLKHAQVMGAKAVAHKKTPLRDIAVSFFAFSVLFLICYRSSLINESFSKVNSMKSQLENIKTKNAQIESDIQTQTDLSNIESYAKYQLGMQKPKDSQIQRIVIDKQDKISAPVVIEEEEKSFLERLWNDVKNILD